MGYASAEALWKWGGVGGDELKGGGVSPSESRMHPAARGAARRSGAIIC
jgi:hypothetical protein